VRSEVHYSWQSALLSAITESDLVKVSYRLDRVAFERIIHMEKSEMGWTGNVELLVLGIVGLAMVVVFVSGFPDLIRYLKIKSM